MFYTSDNFMHEMKAKELLYNVRVRYIHVTYTISKNNKQNIFVLKIKLLKCIVI